MIERSGERISLTGLCSIYRQLFKSVTFNVSCLLSSCPIHNSSNIFLASNHLKRQRDAGGMRPRPHRFSTTISSFNKRDFCCWYRRVEARPLALKASGIGLKLPVRPRTLVWSMEYIRPELTHLSRCLK